MDERSCVEREDAMRRSYLSIIAIIAVMVGIAAGAAVTAGTVTAVDTTKHTVTLDDGGVYTGSATTDLTRIKLGYTIQVTFSVSERPTT
jgi:hypothetical protein